MTLIFESLAYGAAVSFWLLVVIFAVLIGGPIIAATALIEWLSGKNRGRANERNGFSY